MTLDEAVQICEGWFAYLQRQKNRSVQMQKLAVLARTEPEEAKRKLRQLDGCSVTVYDAGRLEPAVRCLIKACSSAAKD